MVFYDTATNKQGICAEIDRLCDSDDTAYPRVAKTSRVNEAYKSVVVSLINADGTWQFDDSNKTDEPRGKGNLVEGQTDYTFASDYLQIEAMDYLDLNNRYIRLAPLDQSELGGLSPEDYFGVDSNGNILTGVPQYYDLFSDDSFRIYPAPSATYCTLTNGLRVWFKRNPTTFAVATDTSADTTEPGFAVEHDILAYMASIPYCMTYHPQRVALYEARVQQKLTKLINHYSKREKEKRKLMTFSERTFE